jgi:Protein of unknown function (DUF1573)
MFWPILLILFSSLAIARADLAWEKQLEEFHVAPEDKAVIAHFGFKNTGTEPLTIKRVTTSCGCTSAKLAKNTYAPGESGEIEVKFTFGLRRGPQRKIVSVTSADKQEWRLELRCWIHEPLTVSPALVYWKSGSEPEAKIVKLTAGPGQPINIKSVKSSSPRFKTSLAEVKPGQEYALTVTPADTTENTSAELTIETDVPQTTPRSYKVFARIK